jgi:UDP-N-acetylmuramate dehydrogenase
MIDIETLKSTYHGGLRLSEPLAIHTSFRIGGPVDLYLEPNDAADVVAAVRYLRAQAIPFVVLGNGSNVLIADEGIRGAAMSLEQSFSFVRRDGEDVLAGAGIRLAQFVDFCIQEGLQGTEMLAGIPGTLGGAITMNAGAYGGEIGQHCISVQVVRGETVSTVTKREAGFAYRASALQGDIVLSSRFRFPHGDTDAMRTMRRETMVRRNTTQPVQLPNAGSIFKNPEGGFAAQLIEACGLKGTTCGGAEVSAVHANFIVNRERATARDVITLIELVRSTVARQTGVHLELEVKLIGFGQTVNV